MDTDWKIKIIDKGYKLARDIYIYRRLPNGETEIMGKGGEFTLIAKHSAVPDVPTLELSPEQLQSFADALADIGIKPQEGFLEGKLEATEKHLADMRTLVFKTPSHE